MKIFILTILVTVYTVSTIQGYTSKTVHQDCPVSLKSYQESLYNFAIPLYKEVALKYNAHFIFGINTVWIMLAAIAEGGSEEAKQQLFKLLRVPHNVCLRENYYKIITASTSIAEDVTITNTRNLFIDNDLTTNPEWFEFVARNSLIDVVKAPIKDKPVEGNSMMLDTITFNGTGTTTFSGAVIEKSSFYNQAGRKIGFVDLMKLKRKARVGYVKSINAKVLDIPVGKSGSYRMLMVLILDKRDLTEVIATIQPDLATEMFSSLKESKVPIDIAVPRFKMTALVNMRKMLENLGVKDIWTNPEDTKFISVPPAFPSSYVQHATLNLYERGVRKRPAGQASTQTINSESLGLDPEVGTDFIVNKPFLAGIYEAETQTPLIVVGVTKPTYP